LGLAGFYKDSAPGGALRSHEKIFRDVVAIFRGDAMPHRPDFLDGLVCCVHVSMSPGNSGGVTSSGVFNPIMVLIRRISIAYRTSQLDFSFAS
jgi:hypothetical protein